MGTRVSSLFIILNRSIADLATCGLLETIVSAWWTLGNHKRPSKDRPPGVDSLCLFCFHDTEAQFKRTTQSLRCHFSLGHQVEVAMTRFSSYWS